MQSAFVVHVRGDVIVTVPPMKQQAGAVPPVRLASYLMVSHGLTEPPAPAFVTPSARRTKMLSVTPVPLHPLGHCVV